MIDAAIFKANDIRGLTEGPQQQWDEAGAEAIGAAFVDVAGLAGKALVMGRDMRTSGGKLAAAFARGALKRGADVHDTGLASTDQLWFASGSLDLPGVQMTASHNPADYNGIKFCHAGARPVEPEFLAKIGDLSQAYEADPPSPYGQPGTFHPIATVQNYAEYLLSLVPLRDLRTLRIVVDAGNGMAGATVGPVLGRCNVEVIGLFLELDGTFPNHQPNPLEPQNLVDAQQAVREHGADIGLVFDGDADRCFIIDERGEVVTPSVITAMVAQAELAREPGATIVVNKITSQTVAEVVAEHGGQLAVSRVGHTYVKAKMAEHHAIFGGEHSAHYYFRDFWGADTGMLAALHVLRLLGAGDVPLSHLTRDFDRYAASGEINSTVADATATQHQVAAAFEHLGTVDWDDGLTVSGADAHGGAWWLNLRASNTEPLLRLNVEAKDAAVMQAIRDDVLDLVRKDGGHD